MLCLTSAVQCVFSDACDLYSMFWRGTCEEALLKWDNRTWSTGSPLVGGMLCPDLTSFIHCALPACALRFNAIPNPSLDSTSSLLSQSQAADGGTDKASRDGEVGCMCGYVLPDIWVKMKSWRYCEESTARTGVTCVFIQVCMVTFIRVKPWSLVLLQSVRNSLLTSASINRVLTFCASANTVCHRW